MKILTALLFSTTTYAQVDCSHYTFPMPTNIMTAIYKEDVAQLDELIQKGADINEQQTDGNFALAVSCSHRWKNKTLQLKFIRSLLNAGANPNLVDCWGETALFKCAPKASAEVIADLVSAGSNRESKSIYGVSICDQTLNNPEPLVEKMLCSY